MDALLLIPILRVPMFGYHFGTNPSPDVGVYVVGFVVGSELLRLSDRCDRNSAFFGVEAEEQDIQFSLLSIAVLSAVGITVKLSFVVFAACAGALALGAVLYRRRKRPLASRTILWALVLCLLLLGTWMIRGVILSGYPAYPSRVAGVDVEWRVDPVQAKYDADIVRSWARKQHFSPEQVLGNWRWLWPWINRMARDRQFEVVLPLALGVVLCPLLLFLGRGCCPEAAGAARKVWIFPLLPMTVLVTWFFLAPEPRFAGMAFWLLGAGALALVGRHWSRDTVGVVVLSCSVLLFSLSMNVLECLLEYGRDMGPARVGRTEVKTTDSGLNVRVPVDDNRAWDAPLPWTPHWNPKLRLRTPGDLSGGFLIER
jgi:hypothetical protein